MCYHPEVNYASITGYRKSALSLLILHSKFLMITFFILLIIAHDTFYAFN